MSGTHTFAKQTPSSWWYSLCAILFLIPVGIGALIFVRKLTHLTDGLTQVVVPGSKELKFDRPGVNAVFLEEDSVVNGKIYSTTASVAGLKCSIYSQDGSTIQLRRPSTSTNYTLGGRTGKSVLEFSVPKPGTYDFQCGYEEGQKGPETVLAVGGGVTTGIIMCLVVGFVSFGVGVGLALIAFFVVYRMQRRSALAALRATALNIYQV